MSIESCNHEIPVRPPEDINTTVSEMEARRKDDEDLVLNDAEYRDWVEGPEEEGGGDAQEPLERKIACNVKTPKKSEIEEHEKTHLPFRSWCKCCVKGRGVASPHSSIWRDDPAAPEVFLDYCFPRATVTILGIKHGPSGATASLLVPKKARNIVGEQTH